MNQDEKRRLENSLIRMGLAKLDDRQLMPQLGAIVSAAKDPHEFLRGMLNECAQDKRVEMYEALRPHLRFAPKPLDVYIAELKEHAGNVESWGDAVKVGENKYEVVPVGESTGAVITLRCSTCTRTHDYYGDTPVQAVILARQDGWVRDKATQKEVCPKCECADRGERRKCPSCTRRHYAPPCTAVVDEQADPAEQAIAEEKFRKTVELVN
jgi:hypothetical protein